MAYHLTLDTNIILDILQKREPWHNAAEKILRLASREKVKLAITTNTVTDIYYIINRKNAKLNAREAIARFAVLMDLISVDKNDCIKALTSKIDDYEDALLSVCAAKAKSDYIVTRNTKDFVNSKVPPITPDDFLNAIYADNSSIP